ncbi:arsenite methyltransferase [Paenibacillus crassostreae]|uniref:Arsenite methyltransferase n=1 Tax=Paenibacillus crassostreae TaxID=1763538 RepID=A0A167GAU7_9BACL|nr:arsenite methyltransferase [Paenibacillus crassostreae]AOZ92629.1 arsenite S-adenosylmethyltransferase [Paenibacillus crassostreae]OAB77396.1 arsenite S-adenosylmethyltransferase [Paenibacillus crassostreae]
MTKLTNDQIRQNVRGRYQQIAVQQVEPSYSEGSTHTNNTISCCDTPTDFNTISAQLGYSNDELSAVPEGANLGPGCGNPQAIADMQLGEVVLDLGSGGGFDCFLASRQVGDTGHVLGVDMTPEMVSRARNNAIKGEFTNTEFRLGEIEYLPVADNTVNVIISNCVINLSPDKQQVFREAYRVLQPGGRLAISDIVTTAELPPEIKNDMNLLYSGCISGASSIDLLSAMLEQSGFSDISIEPKDESLSFIKDWVPGSNIENYIVSAIIKATKK